MAVTQYIGSRYVPLFADPIDWDITRAYEPLTIVYYQGNSYTSKQSVPTGIDVTNTTYWAITGNYNAQIEQYRREVQAFDGRITANAQAIADEVTARMAEDTAIRGLISDLQDDLTAEESARETADTQIRTDFAAADTQIRTDFAAADAQISANVQTIGNRLNLVSGFGTNLTGKKVLCIGDSLTKHPPVSKWWPTYLAENTGCTTYNFAISGTGFIYGSPNTFLKQLQNAHDSSDFNDSDITDIIIAGGYNDYASSESDEKAAVKTCIEYAKQTFVNATIHVAAMLHGTTALDAHGMATVAQYRSRLIAPIHDACMEENCCWIDGAHYWCIGKTDFDFGDGVHTTPAGQNYIAGYMASHLSGGSTDRIICKRLSLASSAPSEITNFQGFAYAKNGMVNVNGKITYSNVSSNINGNISNLGAEFAFNPDGVHPNPATNCIEKLAITTPATVYTPRVYMFDYNHEAILALQGTGAAGSSGDLYFSFCYPFGL